MKEAWKRAGRAAAQLYPRGVSLFWVAPAVLALVVLPEFAQHVAEIELGMFEGREQAKAVAPSPTRMAFGYVKIAGLLAAILASARFWWTRGGKRHWADPRGIAWGRLVVGAVIFMGVPELVKFAATETVPALESYLTWGVSLLLMPMAFLMLSGLFGDRDTPLSAMWRRAWPWLLLTVVLLVLAFGPSAWLHQMNHRWAMGADPLAVWGLMIFDSLLVGLLAGLTGTAFYLGYAAFARPDPQ